MLIEAAALFLALHGPSAPAALFDRIVSRQVVYHARTRSTSNWRWQAVRHLKLSPEKLLTFVTGVQLKRLPRCIRLNNYWCIKKAGWVGEVAADAQGHVAFSSSLEGAIVAARLLRRYYVDYKRTSALAIVSRWAPAQCGLVARPRGGRVARGIARRGIHNTLRARFLARHGRGGIAKKARGRKYRQARARLRRSRIRSRPIPMMRAPAISPGLGEIALPAMKLASLAARPAPKIRRERAIPRIGCTSEALRIRRYATLISKGLVENNKADLKLFTHDGAPGPNLAPVMHHMAAVEIGPYKADTALITAAIKALASIPPTQNAPSRNAPSQNAK